MIIYHNPRCRKSREALRLLNENGIEPEVVEYLKSPLSVTDLEKLVAKLGVPPEHIVRKGEAEYKSNFKGRSLSDSEWIQAMIRYPKLMERPIVEKGENAVVGRPPELVLKLLKN